ncbi:MAG: hypothetical protein NC400_04460 [Clostridium sp.]|nr:hypothetical protein [Clostridium sp.]
MMNVKYYLRGLGIGVIVTALIMGIAAGNSRKTLSDEEIKARARALGMTEESDVLADVLGEEKAGSLSESAQGGKQEGSQLLPASTASQEEGNLTESLSAAGTLPEGGEDGLSGENEAQSADAEKASPEPEEKASPEPEKSEDSSENGERSEEGKGAEEGKDAEEAEGADADSEQQLPGGSVTIQVESGEGSFIVCQKLEDAGLIPLASAFDRYLYENGYDKRINVGTYEIPVGATPEEIARIIARLG